ncbi:MAG: hypothetical protein R3E66_15540 [bacterium]
MLKWLRSLGSSHDPADRALRAFSLLSDPDEIENVWDAMDQTPDAIWDRVQAVCSDPETNALTRKSGLIWMGYTTSNRGEPLPPHVQTQLVDLVVWALGHEANNVLIGGALACLDALDAVEKEATAIEAFRRLGDASARRYWLTLKVRTVPMLTLVAESLREFEPEELAKLTGAFRQFGPEDRPALEAIMQGHTHPLLTLAWTSTDRK